MQIKSLKKLPVAARTMCEHIYDGLVADGKSESMAEKISWEITKNNYKPITTTKSTSFSQTYTSSDKTHIDVLMGFPTVDAHGEYLDIWQDSPMKPLIGDMEHINEQKVEGLPVDYPDMWEGFTPIADKYYHKDNELWAKVELPNHEFAPQFLKDWENGKYGVSIEYAAQPEAIEYEWMNGALTPVIKQAEITGFSFTENPAIDTKPKK